MRKAIQLLRESTPEEDYAVAFGEMDEGAGAEPWDAAEGCGGGEPTG
ncbi:MULTISPECIES: hypothetical protein [Streptosporangium]|nr:hypothetical protein [Streptosporangium brasiliense]